MQTEKLENINLLLMDVDGVLTDGSILYTGTDAQTMAFSVKDGVGIRMLQRAGIVTGVVTGRKSDALSRRVTELGINMCFDGVSDKALLLEQILDKTGCSAEETAFIADDLPDMAIMRKVGVAIAVADASADIKSCAEIITTLPGGKGAVREVCDAILKAKNLWADALQHWE